jgi:hypothetical protein
MSKVTRPGAGELFEEDFLDPLTLEQLLGKLDVEGRLVIELAFGLVYPKDWPWSSGPWPPTYAEIAAFVGMKTRGRPLSEGSVRYIRKQALLKLRGLL